MKDKESTKYHFAFLVYVLRFILSIYLSIKLQYPKLMIF